MTKAIGYDIIWFVAGNTEIMEGLWTHDLIELGTRLQRSLLLGIALIAIGTIEKSTRQGQVTVTDSGTRTTKTGLRYIFTESTTFEEGRVVGGSGEYVGPIPIDPCASR